MKKAIKIVVISIILTFSLTIFSFAYSDDTLSLTNSSRASSGPVCGDVLEENKGLTYNLSPFDHFKCMTCIRTTTKAKTTVTTLGSTNTYAITNVYKANGTNLGVIHGVDEARPNSSWTISVTASVSTSGITVRSANHYGYNYPVCQDGEHIAFYYN